MKTLHVKKGDNVVVLSGKDKGKTGRILACSPEKSRVQVEDVAPITLHKKPRSAQNSGGRISDFGFIHSSNVQIICPNCNKPTRVAHVLTDGNKYRACKHCNASLDTSKQDKKSKKSVDKKSEKKVDDKKAEKKVVDKKAEKADKKVGDKKAKKSKE